MSNRRQIAFGLAALVGASGLSRASTAITNRWHMPDESEPHARTWMAFCANPAVWGDQLAGEVKQNLALIARTIAGFEPVSMLVSKADRALARSLVGTQVELIECPLDDLWMRDTGPVFVRKPGAGLAGVDFNFNGWGAKQTAKRDRQVARFVLNHVRLERVQTTLVLEGGGIEVDGEGTAIITESCVLNANRNPGVSKAACERELQRVLGIDKVIWLAGVKGRDITDGHTDFYARFASPGVVVAGFDPDPDSFDHRVTQTHLATLRSAKDARGRALDVHLLHAPDHIRPGHDRGSFAAGYVNFYVCNGGVIAPEFGDPQADSTAKQLLERLFPGRRVVLLNIDAIAAGGGGIHCTTQQQPKV